MIGHYDLVVIGSGPAGEKGAAQAAYFGKKVALVERAPTTIFARPSLTTPPFRTCISMLPMMVLAHGGSG